MRIRLLILTLLIIGVHQHIQAQYMLGTIGMINIPTADRQKPGTVMLGGNYLPKQMMPARFDYNTGNYFVSISFFSFLELAYRETLIKGDYVSSKPKYNQQDRSYSILTDRKFLQWNKCHVIATREQGILVKRLMPSKQKNCLTAISDNKDYPPFDIPLDEITGIALVVGSVSLE